MQYKHGNLEICVIVAMTQALVIGKNGALPWRQRSDMRRFRELTLGQSVVMGYCTFEEIIKKTGRPLDGRKNYVVTRRHTNEVRAVGATPVGRPLEPVVSTWAAAKNLFVSGGQQVYTVALPWAERLFVTLIEADIEGDAHFPKINTTK